MCISILLDEEATFRNAYTERQRSRHFCCVRTHTHTRCGNHRFIFTLQSPEYEVVTAQYFPLFLLVFRFGFCSFLFFLFCSFSLAFHSNRLLSDIQLICQKLLDCAIRESHVRYYAAGVAIKISDKLYTSIDCMHKYINKKRYATTCSIVM